MTSNLNRKEKRLLPITETRSFAVIFLMNNTTETLKENLNAQQLDAIQSTEGPVMVLAGAGSGKTKVLVHRIANIIQKYNEPNKILAITFTNKAASEMRQRVRNLIGPDSKQVWLHTFHAFCARVLREDIEALGNYRKGFSIYDTDDCKNLLKNIFKTAENNIKQEYLPPPKELLEIFSKLKTNPNYYDKLHEEYQKGENEYISDIFRVYLIYQQKLKNNNAVDFDDLLLLTVKLFEEHEWIKYKYQAQFKYIMVDEYQDTNNIQYKLVSLLSQNHQNLCVVGDADQSIYSWRGANIENILSFKKDYPNAKVIKLEINYRSTKPIIDAANNVIKNNKEREDKTLKTSKNGAKIKHYHFENDIDESNTIASMIQTLKNKYNIPYNKIAILYRINSMANHFETSLITSAIPYQITGGMKLFEYKEIKDIIGYLKILVNPYDSTALKRIINTPKRGLGNAAVNKILDYSNQINIPIIDAVTSDEIKLTPKAKTGLETFTTLFFDLLNQKEEAPQIKPLLENIINQTKYIEQEYIIPEKNESQNNTTYQKKVEKIKEEKERAKINFTKLLTIADYYDQNTESPTLEEFLNNLSLMSDESDQVDSSSNENENEETPAVKLMTLHSAKGLEFPVVFLVGMEEGILPFGKCDQNPKDLEEERRLCYVGLTRAENLLIITDCESRFIYGNFTELNPSRFLKEIPEEDKETKNHKN